MSLKLMQDALDKASGPERYRVELSLLSYSLCRNLPFTARHTYGFSGSAHPSSSRHCFIACRDNCVLHILPDEPERNIHTPRLYTTLHKWRFTS
jgi:hypothetical protein